MSVVFEEQGPLPSAAIRNRHGKIVGWLMQKGITKTVGQAQTLLLVLALIMLCTAGYVGKQKLSDEPLNPAKNIVPVR